METKKVQVSVDKKREQRIEKETKKGRGEREGIPSFFGEGGSAHQHILCCMWVTLSVCHFDTSPLNAKAKRNTVTSNKREKENKESQKHVVGSWKVEKKHRKDKSEWKKRKFKSAKTNRESDRLKKKKER